MTRQFFFLLAIGFSTMVFSQKDVEILKAENGSVITYYAKSNVKGPVSVEFGLEGQNFTTSVSMPVKTELKSLEKKELVKITMGEGASYQVSFKYMKGAVGQGAPSIPTTTANSEGSKERPELLKGIVIFSKDGCGKCEFAKSTLKQKGKTFTELNITKNEADADYMWKKLQDGGFSGGSVQTPVIMIDGKVYFNMDLNVFLKDIK